MYSFLLPYYFGWVSLLVGFVFSFMTSFERLSVLDQVPQEPDHTKPDDPKEWRVCAVVRVRVYITRKGELVHQARSRIVSTLTSSCTIGFEVARIVA